MPRQLGASDQTHQSEIRKRLHNGVHAHPTNLLHLSLRDRLAVRDDRQRLEGGAGEAVRTIQLQQRAHVAPAHGRGLQTVLSAGADEREAAFRNLERFFKSAQRLLDLAGGAGFVHLHDLGIVAVLRLHAPHAFTQIRHRQRRFAGEKQRADDLLQAPRKRKAHVLRLVVLLRLDIDLRRLGLFLNLFFHGLGILSFPSAAAHHSSGASSGLSAGSSLLGRIVIS